MMAAWKIPVEMNGFFDKFFKDRIFPEIWKTGKLIFIHKGKDKLVSCPTSYRTICLIELSELLINGRLDKHNELTSGLSENQFEFRGTTSNAIKTIIDRSKLAGSSTWVHGYIG